VRDARLRHNDLSLSYASINWIRFEGSSCRAVRSMTSQPPVGAPLAVCKVTLRIGGVNRVGWFGRRAGACFAWDTHLFLGMLARCFVWDTRLFSAGFRWMPSSERVFVGAR
jgi:hypothetical protein